MLPQRLSYEQLKTIRKAGIVSERFRELVYRLILPLFLPGLLLVGVVGDRRRRHRRKRRRIRERRARHRY